MTRMRWVSVGAILGAATVVGVAFGYLAVAPGVLTLFLVTSPLIGRVLLEDNRFRAWGEERFGSDPDERPGQ